MTKLADTFSVSICGVLGIGQNQKPNARLLIGTRARTASWQMAGSTIPSATVSLQLEKRMDKNLRSEEK